MRLVVARWAACGLLVVAGASGAWYLQQAPSTSPSRTADSAPQAPPGTMNASVAVDSSNTAAPRIRQPLSDDERRWQATEDLTLWLDGAPEWVRAARQQTGEASNIHRDD